MSHYIRNRWDYLTDRKNGTLYIEGVSVRELAKKYCTPLYVLVERTIRERFREFKKAFPYPRLRVQYATKCNSNLEIMRIANQEDIELDASSVGEIILGLLADFEPKEITFTNLYKTEQDILFAARIGVQAITVDSIEELALIEQAGKKLRKKIPVFLRFNPIIDVGSYSSRKLQYGIPYAWFRKSVDIAMHHRHIDVVGLHFHGSYITNSKVYFLAAKKMMKIAEYLITDYNHRIKFFDLGGGFPIATGDEEVFHPRDMGARLSAYIMYLANKINLPLPKLIFEPGKFCVANAGIGLVKVISSKRVGNMRTVIVDGSTYAFLPDPLIYDAYYDVLPATKMRRRRQYNYRISGCTCDNIDIMAQSAYLPRLEAGDMLAIMDCGAYSNTMASNFNSLKRAPMVMIKENGTTRLIRRRDRYSDMFAPELDVLKVADPNELKHYYNLLRVNMDKVWGEHRRKKKLSEQPLIPPAPPTCP